MTVIDFKKVPFVVSRGVIYVSENSIRFDTTYRAISNKTSREEVFDFNYATGPEFDPKTHWVYTSKSGHTLHVCNDHQFTEAARQVYLLARGC